MATKKPFLPAVSKASLWMSNVLGGQMRHGAPDLSPYPIPIYFSHLLDRGVLLRVVTVGRRARNVRMGVSNVQVGAKRADKAVRRFSKQHGHCDPGGGHFFARIDLSAACSQWPEEL